MKVYRQYTNLVRLFKFYSVDEPHNSALNILQKALNIPYPLVYTKQTMFSNCSSHHLKRIERMYFKRRTMMPIQYVIGEWEFRDLLLKMRPPVLIPRTETSYLVELVNKLTKQNQNAYFLEIGSGTGAISLSLLKENKLFHGVAIDKQKYCVQLTKENLLQNKINEERLELKHQDYQTYSHLQLTQIQAQKFDFIVSNPPYIPSKTVEQLDKQVRKFEDKIALDGGEDGLDIVKDILDNGYLLLKDKGFIALEVDITHNKLLEQYYKNNTYGWREKYQNVQFFKDQYESDRFCVFFK